MQSIQATPGRKLPWYVDYSPSLSKIVGNDAQKRSFLAWLKFRLSPTVKGERQLDQKSCALIYGPPGVGKTALVKAAAAELGVLLIQLDASELRNKDVVKKVLDGASSTSTLLGEKKKALLIDDVDAISGDDIAYEILNLVRTSKPPVIFTAISKYARSLRFLRGICAEFQFYRLSPQAVLTVLKDVSASRGLFVDEQDLMAIAQQAGGDARAAINDLQSWTLGVLSKRDAQNDVRDAIGEALLSESCTSTISSIDTALSSTDPESIALWIDENLPSFTQDGIDAPYDWLARGNAMMGKGEKKLLFNLRRRGLEVIACGISSRMPRDAGKPQIPWRLFWGRNAIQKGNERVALVSRAAPSLHTSVKKLLAEETLGPLEANLGINLDEERKSRRTRAGLTR